METFDPAEKKRTVKSTAPIAVVVEAGAPGTPGTALTGSAVTELPTPIPAAEPPVRRASGAPPTSGTNRNAIDVKDGTVAVPFWVFGAIPGVLLVGAAAIVVARHRAKTRGALAEAIDPEPGETKERAASRMERPLREGLARKYGVPPGASFGAMTEHLEAAGAPRALIEEVKSLGEDLDFLRYAPQLGEYDTRIAEARKKARKLLPKLA